MSRNRRKRQEIRNTVETPASDSVQNATSGRWLEYLRLAVIGLIVFGGTYFFVSSNRMISSTDGGSDEATVEPEENVVPPSPEASSPSETGKAPANEFRTGPWESSTDQSEQPAATVQFDGPRIDQRKIANGHTAGGASAQPDAASPSPERPSPSEMVWVPGNTFTMGTSGTTVNRNEQPAHAVQLDGFWIDEHEVTNAQFQQFVNATGYVTTAELKPDWEQLKKDVPPGTPKPPDDVLVPGALVFKPTPKPVPTDNVGQWWFWTPGASWKHPEGPSSTIAGREDHPVVQVSWDDATAYAKWAGKRLPTEAEWECAARGKLVGKRFTWGDEPPTEASRQTNIWQGVFPSQNDKLDGWDRTSPVKTYPPNGYDLYDMSGNVWEWCSDWYRADAYAQRSQQGKVINPAGPKDSWDPGEPNAAKRVIRGGSFLCHVTYCESYRTAARRGNTPDTGMSHLGFRCVMSAKKADQ